VIVLPCTFAICGLESVIYTKEIGSVYTGRKRYSLVTPTCPYCPQAVSLAHQVAIASPHVRADMVEAVEFPELAIRYQVMGVPRTVINERVHIEGAAPEPMVLGKLREALVSVGV